MSKLRISCAHVWLYSRFRVTHPFSFVFQFYFSLSLYLLFLIIITFVERCQFPDMMSVKSSAVAHHWCSIWTRVWIASKSWLSWYAGCLEWVQKYRSHGWSRTILLNKKFQRCVLPNVPLLRFIYYWRLVPWRTPKSLPLPHMRFPELVGRLHLSRLNAILALPRPIELFGSVPTIGLLLLCMH